MLAASFEATYIIWPGAFITVVDEAILRSIMVNPAPVLDPRKTKVDVCSIYDVT